MDSTRSALPRDRCEPAAWKADQLPATAEGGAGHRRDDDNPGDYDSTPQSTYILFAVEVKNVRSVSYPCDHETWDLLTKLGDVPGCSLSLYWWLA